MADKQNLLLLFNRPQEPVFMDKNSNKDSFDVPEDYVCEKYKKIAATLVQCFSTHCKEKIPVKHIPVKDLPDLTIPMELGRNEQFSVFNEKHQYLAGCLIDIFMGMQSIDDLQSIAIYGRDRLNPYMFNYALSVALLHRPDTKGLKPPLFIETFPDEFMDTKSLGEVREHSFVVPAGLRTPVKVKQDNIDAELKNEHQGEARLWYFREDIGINLHHWHWHLVYPFESTNRDLVAKDRRGELFYYMHQQIIARYNFERFSNQLPRVKRFNDFREPIPEAYFPEMNAPVPSHDWPARIAGITLKDVDRDDNIHDIADLERWRDLLYITVHLGGAINEQGDRVPLDNETGIDTLGNMVESSILSPNRQIYGHLHNKGHIFIASCHDPDNRYNQPLGVMSHSATAMRDPMFYRWHAFIDDIFQEYKKTLPPYTTKQLDFTGVQVTGVSIEPEGGTKDAFHTFWNECDVNIEKGLDFQIEGSLFVKFTHLQHKPFTYRIRVNNASPSMVKGTCRIFLAPKFDDRGKPMLFHEQRLLMIEMDKFVVSLNPGSNNIARQSVDSSVTIPFERIIGNSYNKRRTDVPKKHDQNFCGCGWPQHMLVPKGTLGGLKCEIFVMISDYALDGVDQDYAGVCDNAASFCGIRDRLYPDKRPMGFPFDRLARSGVDSMSGFLTPNMFLGDCTISHTKEVVEC